MWFYGIFSRTALACVLHTHAAAVFCIRVSAVYFRCATTRVIIRGECRFFEGAGTCCEIFGHEKKFLGMWTRLNGTGESFRAVN